MLIFEGINIKGLMKLFPKLQSISVGMFVFLILFITINLYSQEKKIVYPHGVFWHKTEINHFPFEPESELSDWGWGIDYVYRSKNEFNEGSIFDTDLRNSVRPWINYQMGENARLSLSPIGLMKTNEYVAKESDLSREPYYELRSTLQFFHHMKNLGGRIMHTNRYRYELRWQYPGLDFGEDPRFFQRFRYRYRIRVMLNRESFYDENVIYAMASNEIGLNFGENVIRNIFNQNRLYLGLGIRLFNALRLEARYVNRFRTRGATGIEFDNGQGFMLCMYIDDIKGLQFDDDVPRVRFTD